MNTQVERLEHNMVKLTVTVSAEDFKKAITKAYLKAKGRINIPGFRKGKAPQQIIERMYGPEIFYDDAVNFVINDTYSDAADEAGIEFTSRPEFDVYNIETATTQIYIDMARQKRLLEHSPSETIARIISQKSEKTASK